MKHKIFLRLMLGLTLLAGCSSSGSVQKNGRDEQRMHDTAQATPTPSQGARPYSKDLGELRANFNRDKGKVRLVTLLSPT